jgi:hypothetical protein
MLTKIRIQETMPDSNIKLHPLLKKVINSYFIKHSIYFTNGKYVINDKSNYTYMVKDNEIVLLNKLSKIPINFCNLKIWKSINVFDQNNYSIANKIRRYVIFILNNQINNINCQKLLYGIGGEFYGYFISLKKYTKYIGYSNNSDILTCARFNFNIYNITHKADIKLLDYNSKELDIVIPNKDYMNDIIINLSVITYPIISNLINYEYNNIIIINCKSKNISRIKLLLSKYKLMSVYYFENINIFHLSIKHI